SGYDASAAAISQGYMNGKPDADVEVHQGNDHADNLGDGDNAEMFVATKPFDEIQVLSPTWNDETGTKGYTIKLFAWKGDYDTTVAGAPIATSMVTNFKDNAWVSFWFPTQKDGNYLWLATDPIKPPVGHWR